jgi:hypothetical protein
MTDLQITLDGLLGDLVSEVRRAVGAIGDARSRAEEIPDWLGEFEDRLIAQLERIEEQPNVLVPTPVDTIHGDTYDDRPLYDERTLLRFPQAAGEVDRGEAGIRRSYGWGRMSGIFWLFRECVERDGEVEHGAWMVCRMDGYRNRRPLDAEATAVYYDLPEKADWQEAVEALDAVAAAHRSRCTDDGG